MEHAEETLAGSASNPSRRPAKELRRGALKLTIWANPTKNGRTRLSIVPRRIFKRDEGSAWEESDAFGVEDLLGLSELLREAWRDATTPNSAS